MATVRNALPLLLFILVAGCSNKTSTPSTTAALAATRPFLEIQPRAVDMLRRIAQSQKLGYDWYVRLQVVWKPTAKIEVQIDKKQPGRGDFTIEADGLKCVMAAEQKPYLKGAYVEVVQTNDTVYFDVTFPNQDDRDRATASEWLKTEEAKRDERTTMEQNAPTGK